MRKYQKYILPVLILFIVVSIMLGKYYENWNAKQIVCAELMEKYGETYLRNYAYLVNKKVLPAYQRYFSFLENKSFLIKATISNSHGAAIEFIPSKEQKFQCQSVTIRIERAIFPDKADGDYNGKAFSIAGEYVYVKDMSFELIYKPRFIDVPKGPWVAENIRVNDINYPYIIIKGGNRRGDWNRKVAKEEALYYFKSDFSDAYFISEEFREFVATPELTDIAKRIKAKFVAGAYEGKYGYLIYQTDLAEIITAADAHGIKRDFAMSIYTFVKEQLPWREKRWFLYPLIFTCIGFLPGFFIWCWRKFRISQRFLLWWRKKKISN